MVCSWLLWLNPIANSYVDTHTFLTVVIPHYAPLHAIVGQPHYRTPLYAWRRFCFATHSRISYPPMRTLPAVGPSVRLTLYHATTFYYHLPAF